MLKIYHWQVSKSKSIIPTHYDNMMFDFKVEKKKPPPDDDPKLVATSNSKMNLSFILN